jgi:hypothetical protein
MEDFSRTANFSSKTEEDRRLTGSVVCHDLWIPPVHR